MLISDWSSDVCSSDLGFVTADKHRKATRQATLQGGVPHGKMNEHGNIARAKHVCAVLKIAGGSGGTADLVQENDRAVEIINSLYADGVVNMGETAGTAARPTLVTHQKPGAVAR